MQHFIMFACSLSVSRYFHTWNSHSSTSNSSNKRTVHLKTTLPSVLLNILFNHELLFFQNFARKTHWPTQITHWLSSIDDTAHAHFPSTNLILMSFKLHSFWHFAFLFSFIHFTTFFYLMIWYLKKKIVHLTFFFFKLENWLLQNGIYLFV